MASFLYVARETASGREIRSSVEAATEQAAIAALLNRNMLVLSIQEKVGKQGRTSGGRVALADLVIFTRQLATMIDAGLAMVQSLQALAEQTTNKVMRDVIHDVCARVESGDSFSEALQKHPKAFSRLYVCMVGRGRKGRFAGGDSGPAGDLSGKHRPAAQEGQIGHDVSDGGDHRGDPDHDLPAGEGGAGVRRDLYQLQRHAAGADAVFDQDQQFREELPHSVCCSAAAAAVYGWFYFIKTPAGRLFWDSRRIKLPIFGAIAHKICLARFTRTLASLVRSGVPILEVLQIVSQTVGNVVMEKAIKTAAVDIERGESISAALAKHPDLPQHDHPHGHRRRTNRQD